MYPNNVLPADVRADLIDAAAMSDLIHREKHINDILRSAIKRYPHIFRSDYVPVAWRVSDDD